MPRCACVYKQGGSMKTSLIKFPSIFSSLWKRPVFRFLTKVSADTLTPSCRGRDKRKKDFAAARERISEIRCVYFMRRGIRLVSTGSGAAAAAIRWKLTCRLQLTQSHFCFARQFFPPRQSFNFLWIFAQFLGFFYSRLRKKLHIAHRKKKHLV